MADKVKDPVCGMEIRPEDAVATEVHEGHTFYFCSHVCHETFVRDPHRYGTRPAAIGTTVTTDAPRAGGPVPVSARLAPLRSARLNG